MSDLSVEEQIVAKFAGAALDTPAPAEAVADTAEPETPEQVEDRPRNADGTFAAKEPEVEAEEQAPLLAGKYKDVAALEQAYAEAQALIGRQGNELSEARALREEFQQLRDQIQKPAAQPTYDPGSIDEYLQSNPQNIPGLAQQALDTGDNYLYQRALEAWGELDRTGAMDFHARAVTAAEVSKLREEFAPALKVSQDVQSTTSMGEAFQSAAGRLPDDFTQVMDSITPENAKSMKTVIDILASGDQASREAALETLYWSEKGRQAGNLTQHAQAAQQQVAQEALEARQDAQVASGSGSQDRVPLSGVDAWRQQFQQSDAFKKYSGQS